MVAQKEQSYDRVAFSLVGICSDCLFPLGYRAAVTRILFTTLRRSFADGLAFCALVASVSGTLDFASAAKVRLSMRGRRVGCAGYSVVA